jgi:uncharacterized membrane protein
MKDIYWNKLTGFEKVIFVLGWFSGMSLVFWLVFLIVYVIKKDEGKQYKEFFNPQTFKVPMVFGWINLAMFILGMLGLILMFFIIIMFG